MSKDGKNGKKGSGRGDAVATPHKIPVKDALKPPLPKRFYKAASASEAAAGTGYAVLLDGRSVKTPKKRALSVPSLALAEAIAAEWNAQGTQIDPATMPLTRFANTAIDAVADQMEDVAADIAAFAGSDLLCYRDAADDRLAARQAAHWDPVLAWAGSTFGTCFAVTVGVMPIEQPPAALTAVRRALQPFDAFGLAALHVMTTLTGSALLALAHAREALPAGAAWMAAHVDEDFQAELWGEDAEAAARRAARKDEFAAASRMLALLARREA